MTVDTTAPDVNFTVPTSVSSTTPTFSGTAEPGSTITLTVDPDNNPATINDITLTTTANADGTWSATVPGTTPLTSGSEIGLEVTATDDAGNSSTTISGTTYVITETLSTPVFDLPTYINSSTPTIFGSAIANSTVDVVIDPDNNPATNDSFTLTTTADGNGFWSVTVPGANGLTDGNTVSVTVTSTDALGQESIPVTDTAIVDTTAAAAPVITSPADGSTTNDTTPTFTGTAEPGTTIVVSYDPDGDPTTDNTVTLTATTDGSGNWSLTVPGGDALTDGSNVDFTITAVDAAGNESTATTTTLTFDTSAPNNPTVNTTDGYLTSTTPTLTGTGEPGSTIEVTIDPDNNPATNDSFTLTTTVNPDGTWSATVPGGNALTEGNTVGISVTSTDEAGNSSTTTTTATVDTTTPTTPVTTIPTTTNTTTPTFSGTGEPGSTIEVTIDPDSDPTTDNSFTLTTTVDGTGNWTVTVPGANELPGGTTATISVTSTDQAGNTSPEVTGSLLVDTTPPDAPQVTIPNVIHTATPTFTGTGEPGSTIELTIDPDNNPATNDSFTLNTTVNPDGTWSITVPGGNSIPDGNEIKVNVVATDEAGNTSMPTTGIATINTTPPSAPSISITPTTGLTTTETGGTATFDVVLTNRPTAEVTITFTLGDPTEGSLSTNTLVFTATDWDVPQTVTVTGVNDPQDDGDITYTITATAESNDPYHKNLAIPTVTVTNIDDDGPPVITSDGGLDTASITMGENQTAVTTVTAVDTDVPTQTLTYSISGGADAGKFSIDSATGTLSFTTEPRLRIPGRHWRRQPIRSHCHR